MSGGRRTLVEDLLVSGLDDWAYASWVIPSVVGDGSFPPDLVRAATFGLFAEVLFEDLMVPGDVVDGVHVPWECPAGEALERIVTEWLAEWGDEAPTPGAIVWLANTAKGEALARACLAREGKSV